MTYYEYYIIFLALIFCGYACYTDIKTQKIRNICSFGLLYAGVLSQFMAWFLGTTTPLYITGLFFGSGIVAFALYWFGIFSPGDSKLFWGLCLILPPPLFRLLSGFISFPPLILTLNIVIPYTIGIIVFLLIKFVFIGHKLRIISRSIIPNLQKGILLMQIFNLLILVGIGSTISYLAGFLAWEINRPLQIGLVLTTFTFVRTLLSNIPKNTTYYAVIGFACIWISLKVSASISGFIYSFAIFLGIYFFIFIIAKQLVLGLAMLLVKDIDIANLQVGMIPAEQIVQTKDQDGRVSYEKRQATFSSGITDNLIITPSATGLSKETITELKKLADQGAFTKYGNQIKIQPDICFAPVITVGVLLTVLCQGPFYLQFIQLF